MKKCSQCGMTLSFWWMRCPICRRFKVGILHIVLLLIFVVGFIVVVDNYMTTDKPKKPKKIDVTLPGSRL